MAWIIFLIQWLSFITTALKHKIHTADVMKYKFYCIPFDICIGWNYSKWGENYAHLMPIPFESQYSNYYNTKIN